MATLPSEGIINAYLRNMLLTAGGELSPAWCVDLTPAHYLPLAPQNQWKAGVLGQGVGHLHSASQPHGAKATLPFPTAFLALDYRCSAAPPQCVPPLGSQSSH